MAARLIPAYQTFHTANGVSPLSGGLIHFFISESVDTDKDTFSDDTLLTANTNPLVLDSAGRVQVDVWGDGKYKMVVADSTDTTIDTFDPVTGSFAAEAVNSIAELTALLKTTLTDGDQFAVSGYTTQGDGGGGDFFWDSSNTDTENAGTIFEADEGGTGRWLRIIEDLINVKMFGAFADGTTDDTVAVQAAVDAGFDTVLIDGDYLWNSVTISSPIKLISHGGVIAGGTGTEYFSVQSNDVEISGFTFGDGATIKEAVVQGFFNSNVDFSSFTNFNFHDNLVDLALTGAKAGLTMFGHPFNFSIKNNRFLNAVLDDTEREQFAIGLRIGDTVASPKPGDIADFTLNGIISDNYFENWNYGFDNFSNGYFNGFSCNNNDFVTCGTTIRLYHIFKSTFTNNRIDQNSLHCYFWVCWHVVGNEFTNSVESAVFLEQLQGKFSNNTILNPGENGILSDGGTQNGIISDNTIVEAGEDGILISPNFNFGGAVIGLVIQNNKVFHCQKHGIRMIDSTFRDMNISGNTISGCGVAAPSLYGGIYFEMTNASNAIDAIVIQGNKIWGDDVLSGVQDSQLEFGVYFDDSVATANSTFYVERNWIDAPIPVKSDTNGGGRFVTFNNVNDTTLIDITGASGTKLIAQNVDRNTGLIV